MTATYPTLAPTEITVPEPWQRAIASRLAAGEAVQAWLEIDLDKRLKFASGLVLLTNRRILAKAPDDADWHEWPLQAGLQLNHHDHAGVGTLELLDANGRLGRWRYTLGNKDRKSVV